GGAPLTSATKARILEHLPTVLIVDGFGSSETGGQMSIVSSFGSATSGTFTPRPDRTAVLNERLDTVLQPGDDEIGWLGTTGRLPLGYLNDEHKTAQVFRMIDGVRYSAPGDHAKHLIDGSIEALGREAVCINTGGEKVFAEEVEEAVLRHQSVRDCVVVGVPSDVWGSEVVAVISLNSNDLAAPTLDDITSTMQHLARYKHPKALAVVHHIRRSPAGKADYPWARAIAMSHS
ncbi:MAG: AMP-binding enzyme, partial [Ilumatobacteraceae bacterium]